MADYRINSLSASSHYQATYYIYKFCDCVDFDRIVPKENMSGSGLEKYKAGRT